jgi:hypothetical protein
MFPLNHIGKKFLRNLLLNFKSRVMELLYYIKSLLFGDSEDNHTIDFCTKDVPFVFHYAYEYCAWGRKANGYFITPDGNKYTYKREGQEEWLLNTNDGYFCDQEGGYISPENLFKNIKSCKRSRSINLKKQLIIEKMDDFLSTSLIQHTECTKSDQPFIASAVYIYLKETNRYFRVILKTQYANNNCKHNYFFLNSMRSPI